MTAVATTPLHGQRWNGQRCLARWLKPGKKKLEAWILHCVEGVTLEQDMRLAAQGWSIASPVLDLRRMPADAFESLRRSVRRGRGPRADEEGALEFRAALATAPRISLHDVDIDIDDHALAQDTAHRIQAALRADGIPSQAFYSGPSGRIHVRVPQLEWGHPQADRLWGLYLMELFRGLGLSPSSWSSSAWRHPGWPEKAMVDLSPTWKCANSRGGILRLAGGLHKDGLTRKRPLPGQPPPPSTARVPLRLLERFEGQLPVLVSSGAGRARRPPVELAPPQEEWTRAIELARACRPAAGEAHQARLATVGYCARLGLPQALARAVAREIALSGEGQTDADPATGSTYAQVQGGGAVTSRRAMTRIMGEAGEALARELRAVADLAPPAARVETPLPQLGRKARPLVAPPPAQPRARWRLCPGASAHPASPRTTGTLQDLHDQALDHDQDAAAALIKRLCLCGIWSQAAVDMVGQEQGRSAILCRSRACGTCDDRIGAALERAVLETLGHEATVVVRVRGESPAALRRACRRLAKGWAFECRAAYLRGPACADLGSASSGVGLVVLAPRPELYDTGKRRAQVCEEIAKELGPEEVEGLVYARRATAAQLGAELRDVLSLHRRAAWACLQGGDTKSLEDMLYVWRGLPRMVHLGPAEDHADGWLPRLKDLAPPPVEIPDDAAPIVGYRLYAGLRSERILGEQPWPWTLTTAWEAAVKATGTMDPAKLGDRDVRAPER